MTQIRDDPIVRCMERSGYPPWLLRGGNDQTQWDAEMSCGKDDDGQYQ